MDISEWYGSHLDSWFVFIFYEVWDVHVRRHYQNHKKISLKIIDLPLFFPLKVHPWRTAAAGPLSTPSIAKTHNLLVSLWPLNLSTARMPAAANVMAKAGRPSFVLDVILPPPLPVATPATNPTKPDKWFRFVLCSPRKKLSIQSGKWCQGFVSKAYEWQKQPTSFHPFTLLLLTLKKTPLQQAKKIESQETLLISVPCILTLTFLNRSSGYKGPERQLLCAKMWLKAFWKVEGRDWIGYCI